MKKSLLALSLICFLATSCDKSTVTPPTTTPTPTPTTTTNAVNGDWTVTIYDSAAVTAPMAATYKATANSTTSGSVKFDITFDGTTHKTEDATYVLSNNNTNIVFTKTAGDYSVLSGGGTWTIDEMTTNTIRMRSSFNLYIKMTK